MSLNKVLLLGRLGKDPELRHTPQNMAICKFTLATNDRRKSETGEWVEQTEWHNVVVFGKSGENCAQYLTKGSQAFVEGRIRTRKYADKDGKDKYFTEIVANSVQFVGSKSAGGYAKGGEQGDGFGAAAGMTSTGSPEISYSDTSSLSAPEMSLSSADEEAMF